MKKIMLTLLATASLSTWAQEVGAAGKLLQNEYRQNKQARTVIGRGGVSVNIDYHWDYDYDAGYSEVFIRIPERDRFTVSIGDQEITNSTGMYRFFDVAAISQPLTIWQGRNLIYRVTIAPRNNTRMIMDFFSREGLYPLEEINLNNNQPSYQGRQWNDVWNRPYGQTRAGYAQHPYPQPMSPAEFDKFFRMYKKETFDDDKISFFTVQQNTLLLTTDQVAQLMSAISFGDNKLTIAKQAYNRVVDPQNYYLLLDKFTFTTEKEAFKDFLKSVQR